MQWIDEQLVLEGERVVLRPMTEADIDGIIAASADPRIWEFVPINTDPESIRAFYLEALDYKRKGTHFPFTIFDTAGSIIGVTRFGDIEPECRKLEIGWTWYRPEYWGKGYNEECKHLLFGYCYEELKAVRVQLKAHAKNVRSRRAILRLGCRFEGIYRNHMIRRGVLRDTAMYSMLPEEWTIAKPKLRALIDRKYAGTYRYTPDTLSIRHQDYTITTDKALMQPQRIHAWLSTHSYWLPGVSYEKVRTAFEHSFCIAVLHEGLQVAYARFVSDYATFAYLADVYVEQAHRGRGLSKKMMETLLDLEWVKGLRKLMLGTRDAHGLYAQYGYTPLAMPERYMEVTRADFR